MKPVVSIGNQDFESIRKNNSFYIDKTGFIKEWWENQDIVTLITRPRRFGKTLNLYMLKYFFDNQYAGRSDLFEGLFIWEDEKYRNLQGSHPVIFFSFADIKGVTYNDTRESILATLAEVYKKHSYLLQGDILDENEKKYFNSFDKYVKDTSISKSIIDTVVTRSLKELASYLNRYYNKKVLIFLDEYDTPLQEAYANGYWNEMTALIRSLFNSTFKTNDYIERALLTGITRVSKESVFSDLNNLEVVTITTEKYASSFGFTEEEVFCALDDMGLSLEKEQVKRWYDGFTFGRRTDIYNPWSITKFLDSGKFGTYWADTSSNRMVSDLIQESTPEMKMQMENLLAEKELEVELDEQVIFEQLRKKKGAVWSLLLASGYLKVVRIQFDAVIGKYNYHLRITNYETMLMFKDMIANWFQEDDTSYNNFKKALLIGDLDYMNQFMNEVAQRTFSSFDTGKYPSDKTNPERFYHGFVLGLIVDLADKYHITSNRESGFGRYDVIMEPKNLSNNAYVIEFKVFNPKKEKNLEESVKNALAQIEKKKYDTELISRGIAKENIFHYGFAFEGKKVLIG